MRDNPSDGIRRGRELDAFQHGPPLETIACAASGRWPPGHDMGDLTPPSDGPETVSMAPPPIRIVTIAADQDEVRPLDTGGADPMRPIGRGNPPRSGQQRAGAPSKNPAGRPPGIPNPDRFSRFLHQRPRIAHADGTKISPTRIERLKEMIARDAANGDRAMRRLMEQIMRDEAVRETRRAEKARAKARKAEQGGMHVTERLHALAHTAHKDDLDLLQRLRDRGIVSRDSLQIAPWMLELIARRGA